MVEETVSPVPFWLCERMRSLLNATADFERRLGLPNTVSGWLGDAEARVALWLCRRLIPERRFEMRPHGVVMVL